jgi:hypothetical protein
MDPMLASDRELADQASPAEKLAQALEMMRAGIRLKRSALPHQFPATSETEIENMLMAWLAQDG